MKSFVSIVVLVAFAAVAATYPVENEFDDIMLPQIGDIDWPSSSTSDAHATVDLHLREKREPRKKHRAIVDIQHTHRGGTDVNAQVQRNLWSSPNGRSTLDGNANFNQHFGRGGGHRPNYGAGVQFNHKF